jgi:hypothetical protein
MGTMRFAESELQRGESELSYVYSHHFRYTVPEAMGDFIVNNEKQKAFILWNEKFPSMG